jgi:hypothetical protein
MRIKSVLLVILALTFIAASILLIIYSRQYGNGLALIGKKSPVGTSTSTNGEASVDQIPPFPSPGPTPFSLPSAKVGQEYKVPVLTSQGESSKLPQGLELTSCTRFNIAPIINCSLEGTPLVSGSYYFQVYVPSSSADKKASYSLEKILLDVEP